MIQALWAWLVGYVTVKLKGPGLERLLNRMAGKGITVWDVERVSTDIVILKVSVAGFLLLRPLLWDLPVQVRVARREGLPFIGKRFRTRQILILGLVCFVGLLYYLSGFIWFIHVEGGESVDPAAIRAAVVGEGLQVGGPKEGFSAMAIETLFRTKFEELSWVGVHQQGSLVRIQIVERSMPDEVSSEVGSIVARRDGVVTQVIPFRGTAVVEPGVTVKQGALLIRSEEYGLYGQLEEVRAEGIVRARVWYEGVGEAAFRRITQHRTGNLHRGYVLSVFERGFVHRGPPPFSLYQVEEEVWQIRVRQHSMPMSITRKTYHEIEYREEEVPADVARALALERAWDSVVHQGADRDDAVRTSVEESLIADSYGVRVDLVVETEENLGEFRQGHTDALH